MAAENSNSIVLICPKEEESETPPSKKSPSTTNEDEPIVATPISVCPPDQYLIEYHPMVDSPTNKETENPKVSPDETTMTEIPSETPKSSSRRGRRPTSPPAWIGNWTVDSKKRPHSNRYDKTYRHKVQGFLCRSLLECERYEKHGIRPKHRRMKAQVKAKNSNKSKDESKAIVLYTGKNIEAKKEAETEEAIIAKRRAKAESMRHIVEEFLAEAHYNQLHMFDP